ncbi:helical backbone metal receptor [Thalassospiraceae bacterium LMO-JJ14]|nr:helical backbone metal receptor [Thalassospiraceae bacterium LMO-JJ14]
MHIPLTDYLGQTFEQAPDARILSLVPSLTELLFDLGLEQNLAGRTQFCIHPAEGLKTVPSVGGTKKIKMDRVAELAPTHALLNVDENPKDMADALRDQGIDVIVTHPMHPDDNIQLFRLIGGIFNAGAKAETLVTAYNDAHAALAETGPFTHRRVLYLIWKDPWMAISPDTYIANMLGLVNWQAATPGAEPALSGDAARYPEVTLNVDMLNDVDLVLFSTEPYAFGKTDIDAFQAAFPEHAHKAHLIDGEMTSWYGSRAISGLGYLKNFAETIAS